MQRLEWGEVLGLAAVLLTAPASPAQQITPHIGYVYPAGGRQGTTVDVTVGGQFLDGAGRVYISGAGVEATVVEHVKPLTPKQFNELREELRKLAEKRASAARQNIPWTAEDSKRFAEIREKLATFVRRPASPAIAETVTLRVTLAPDAAPGERELRLATSRGLTNPLVFCVGQLPEFSKKPAKVRNEVLVARAVRIRAQPRGSAPTDPIAITLPATLNGQIMPGGADRYRFSARKGQRLVVAVSARTLLPFISDAVPGWFQAAVTLFDSGGRELQYADDYRFHPDPVLYYEIPDDGEYLLEIKDALYRGREDFVYRVAIGELPFVTDIFPLGGRAGTEVPLEVNGWNLPAAKLTRDIRVENPGIHRVSVSREQWLSNRMPFMADTLPEETEREPNDGGKNAQPIKLPAVVNGRVGRAGDLDVFRIEGRAGEEIVAEVFARRLESPLDSFLRLTDSSGRQLAANDDYEDKGAGLITHHADSRIGFRLPAAGTYHLFLGDTQRKGGPDYAYRLRIGRPQPDFELRVAPASVTVRAGLAVPITVYAVRKDGFAGDILLRLKGAPSGFRLNGGWIPAGQDTVRLTLTAPLIRVDEPLKLHLEGRAIIEGREVRRLGVPAEDMMQAFAYHHLVPAKEWLVWVAPGVRRRVDWTRGPEERVKLPAGGTAPVRFLTPLGRLGDQLELELSEPPDGITIRKTSPRPEGLDIVLGADAGKVKPGLKGNLIVSAFMLRRAGPDSKKPPAQNRRVPLGVLPAIPFEVVER